ncbi:hypothetical protein FGADI_10195 [Fusarium gaditjirri]|uniref:Uncharacterized protein n=1 Tax=Fusarium gaditjirri TaxID=282569 RepID=A0A8H4SY24_9HYPO|nr:hypothetical protein FGADI_10195 [Fusarium gaditjirri]
MSGLINKVKDAIHSDKDKSYEQPEGTQGGHSSRAANAADPRYDSDRDHRANPGTTTTGGLGSSTHNTGTTGLTGGSTYSENMPSHTTTGRTENLPGHTTAGGLGSHSSGLPEGTTGPHGSRLANAADPKVDSDLDGSRRVGGSTGTYGQTATGTSGLSSHGVGTHGDIGGTSSGYSTGPRNTQGGLGGSTGTYGQTTTGTSGLSSHGSGAHGPTGTHTSGLGGTGSTGTYGSTGTDTGAGLGGAGSGYSTGPGPAAKTAGPHSSDMANKLDPRVDSDLDGSKTVGKEKTFQQSNNNFAGRDPTDATQVPPSVLQKHVPTEIAHDDPHSDHSRRHSTTHQETHRGL